MSFDAKTETTCPVCECLVRAIFKKGNYEYCKCPECGTVGAYPTPNDEELKDHYSKARNYKTLKIHEEKYRDNYKRTARFLKSVIERKNGSAGFQGSAVLDISCFTGGFVKELLNLGADAYGYDPYVKPEDITDDDLKERILRNQLDLETIQKNIACISLLGVIEHLREPALFLSFCHKITSDNGVIFIQTPDCESIAAKLMGKHFFAYQPVEHIYVFSRRGLVKALKRMGFKDIKVCHQWKFLTISYVYEQLATWGKGFQWLLWPFNKLFPNLVFPFYGGGITVSASKKL
jgi:SAM-dependent methyltransferase